MNIYTLEASGNYGAGIAIVAAHDEEEAKAVAGRLSRYDVGWNVDYSKAQTVELLGPAKVSYTGPCACVLKHFETGE